jgi:hypothetical protein
MTKLSKLHICCCIASFELEAKTKHQSISKHVFREKKTALDVLHINHGYFHLRLYTPALRSHWWKQNISANNCKKPSLVSIHMAPYLGLSPVHNLTVFKNKKLHIRRALEVLSLTHSLPCFHTGILLAELYTFKMFWPFQVLKATFNHFSTFWSPDTIGTSPGQVTGLAVNVIKEKPSITNWLPS